MDILRQIGVRFLPNDCIPESKIFRLPVIFTDATAAQLQPFVKENIMISTAETLSRDRHGLGWIPSESQKE
jgi:hypothetical protein